MPRLLLLIALLPLSLVSCTYSNFGSCIRNSGLTHTGVDVRHPMDGKVYRTPAQRKVDEFSEAWGYVRAPELSYRLDHPFFISYNIKGDHNEPEPYDIRPTGKVRLALAGGYDRPSSFKKSVESIPANARACSVKPNKESKPVLDDDQPQPRPSWWRYVAAAPFDYLIDPVITVAWNTTTYTVSLAATPFLLAYESLSMQTQATPPPPPPPSTTSSTPR